MTHPSAVPGPLLATIRSPEDLRRLHPDQLDDLCAELRDYIIDVVSVHGGHFGASLGVVELTTALHYAYNTPTDQLVWDVGHQAYGHKILTGRMDRFETNRKYGGISGFPKRSESPYDAFGVGHSSTSISAALGMAEAFRKTGSTNKAIAVIGDGSMTAGLAFEALNNAGALGSDILVVLNDNNMSIDPNVGALKEYLADITTSKTFHKIRNEVWDLLGHFKGAGTKLRKVASRLETVLTTALTPGGLFRSLGFKYYGPVDGHNVKALVRIFEDLRTVPGPKLLHVVTVKGKGFAPAERDQVKWHASGSPFDKVTGASLAQKPSRPTPPKYQDVFADTLLDIMDRDETVVGITAAMPSGTSMLKVMNRYPDRAYDVGIAEQHAVTFAAGLATQGIKPVVAIYSSFLQRGYDQVVHDVCIQKLPVLFAIDRGGLVGADGPTHHGLYDLAYLRCIPNIVIASPLDEHELDGMLRAGIAYRDGAFAVRYPRGEATGTPGTGIPVPIPIGKGRVMRDGNDIAVLSLGAIGRHVEAALPLLDARGVEAAWADMRFVKPLDTDLIDELARTHRHIVTVEDGTRLGGFGSAVAEHVAAAHPGVGVTILGIEDRIVEHGSPEELYRETGLHAEGIAVAVEAAAERVRYRQPIG